MRRLPGSDAPFLFIGFSGPESLKSVTAIAFPRSEEVLAENIGLHGSEAMIAVEKMGCE